MRRFLAEEDLRYQRIALPYGLHTGGTDRSATCRDIFPDDMTGKTVLDLGSKYGYFCFEALKRGAQRAVGLDVDPESIRKARMIANFLGSSAEFRFADMEKDPIEEKFDYVLALNVLHHLKDPIATLDKVISITRERLILEVATIGRHDRRRLRLSRIHSFFLNSLPVFYVAQNGTTSGHSGQKFFITAPALRNLLASHRNMFARIEIRPSMHKSRFIAAGHKRRIGKLVVVAGPTSAGKTTLIRKLLSGELLQLQERLGLKDLTGVCTVNAGELMSLHEPQIATLIFHYDFLRPYLRTARTYDRDEALDILDCADEVTFVTIWTRPEVLRGQFEEGEIQAKTRRGKYQGAKRHLMIREDYKDPAKVLQFYRNWFRFCQEKSSCRLVVSLSEGLQVCTPEEWEQCTATHIPASVPE